MDVTDRRALGRLISVIEEFRRLDPEMQAQQMLTLLIVALREGEPVKVIGGALGLSQAAASRNVSYWTDWHWRKRAGLDMIEAVEDKMERRRKLVTLKPKGKRFIAKIAYLMKGEAA